MLGSQSEFMPLFVFIFFYFIVLYFVLDELTEEPSESILDTNYFLSNVSQITKIVETTGSKIISGGLDTLETVGKKTLEVLQDGDPGLRKKRAIFFQNTEKINLSQVFEFIKIYYIIIIYKYKYLIIKY